MEVLNLNADISEWFEYNGKPFFFRVFVNLQDSYTNELEKRIINIINAHKNVRSWLEKLSFYLLQEPQYLIANYILTSEEISI